MLGYPQLATGALSQFPIVKRRHLRTVANIAQDGHSVKLSDPAAETEEWQLQYSALSDSELFLIQQFFSEMEGSLHSFTFVDPSGNLLAWSEDLSNAVWSTGSLLEVTGIVDDPRGGKAAWLLNNSGTGLQSLMQTLNSPAGYVFCFSVYARANQATELKLAFGAESVNAAVGSAWKRVVVSGTGDATADSIVFAIGAAAGASVEIFGPQVEAQESPSTYQTSTTGGVFENARFRDDSFIYTTTDVNRHSATVNIFYAKHR